MRSQCLHLIVPLTHSLAEPSSSSSKPMPTSPTMPVLTDEHRRRNYTGDILNFGLAKEQYAAEHPAKSDKVKFVIVGDDVAVGRTQGKIVGRR